MIATFVTDADSLTSAAAHLAQIGAIVVGAIWTYRRFIKHGSTEVELGRHGHGHRRQHPARRARLTAAATRS